MKHGNSSKYTAPGSPTTRTAIGPAAHRLVWLDSGVSVFAPVKLDFKRKARYAHNEQLRWPLIRHGKCVHALPGGGEFVGGL